MNGVGAITSSFGTRLGPASVICLSLLVLGSGACGANSDVATDPVGSSSTVSEPRDQPDPGSRAGLAVDALVADDMPADEQSLKGVLDALPDELLGRQREGADGEVIYRAPGQADLFLVVMEAEDVGTGDETNRELLEIEARREDRVVTDRQTEPSAGVMYVAGTEGSGAGLVHFVAWTTEHSPYLFAAGGDTPVALDTLINEFAKAAGSQ